MLELNCYVWKCPVIPAVPVPALAATPLRHGTAQPPTLRPVTTPSRPASHTAQQHGSGRGGKGAILNWEASKEVDAVVRVAVGGPPWRPIRPLGTLVVGLLWEYDCTFLSLRNWTDLFNRIWFFCDCANIFFATESHLKMNCSQWKKLTANECLFKLQVLLQHCNPSFHV